MNTRILTLVTLLAWGSVLVWFCVSGRVAAYLHPQFHAPVAVAGGLLLLLAPLWWWATREVQGGCGHCDCHAPADAPRSRLTAGAVFAFAVLLLPLSAATLISPSQFGEAAVMNRGIVTDITQLPSALPPRMAASWEDAPPVGESGLPDVATLPEEEGVEYFVRGADGAIQLETIDLLFAAEEPALREEFADQRVSIVGQYVPPREGSGGFDLVRMFVVCCAADARPLGLKIEARQPVEVPRMGWVRITGTARFDEKDGRIEPRLEADKVETVEAPRETFLY